MRGKAVSDSAVSTVSLGVVHSCADITCIYCLSSSTPSGKIRLSLIFCDPPLTGPAQTPDQPVHASSRCPRANHRMGAPCNARPLAPTQCMQIHRTQLAVARHCNWLGLGSGLSAHRIIGRATRVVSAHHQAASNAASLPAWHAQIGRLQTI